MAGLIERKWRNRDEAPPSGRESPASSKARGQLALSAAVRWQPRKSWHRHRSSSETWRSSSPPHHPFLTTNTMAWSTLGNSSSFVPEVSRTTLSSLPPPSPPFACAVLLNPNHVSFVHITSTHTREKVFKYEPFLFAAVLMYGAFFWFGSKANYTKANTWFVASFHLSILPRSFGAPLVSVGDRQ